MMKRKSFAKPLGKALAVGALLGLASTGASAQVSTELPMVNTNSAATGNGWTATPIFTVGETINNYQPVGIMDGIFAFKRSAVTATVLVNHELGSTAGVPYTLSNGTQLTGARISTFFVRRNATTAGSTVGLLRANLAYDTVYDRAGAIVTSAAQINEQNLALKGFDRFCSSNGVPKGEHGFENDIYFAGEESGKPFLPHGGTMWALDVKHQELWAVPALGRGAWEGATALDTGIPGTIALALGDDTEGSPTYLYIGQKGAAGDGSFLDRNGLKVGQLFAWKADNGDLSPQSFHGVDSFRSGSYVALTVRDTNLAGQPGYDALGYADNDTLAAQADALGCFSFSRPEDVDTNPLDGSQFVFASTGRGQLFPADNWGTLYVNDIDFSDLSADIVIIHDADFLPVPDAGIRSPDNVDWAGNGRIYAMEDKSTSPGSLFGAATGIEASIWQIDPVTRVTTRVAEIDRSVVAPAGTTDAGAGEIGNWESSGILDVTDKFGTQPGERLLIGVVQAHGIKDGVIGGSAGLGEGGQLFFLSKVGN